MPALALVLGACGQTGPLTLPGPRAETPPQDTAPETPDAQNERRRAPAAGAASSERDNPERADNERAGSERRAEDDEPGEE